MRDRTVLLTKPPVTRYPLGWKLYAPMVPMGLAFIGASLDFAGIDFCIVDNYARSYRTKKFDKESFVRILNELDPFVVGISCMSIEYNECLELIELVKQESDAKIIIGGPHATLFPELFSNIVDYVVVGEGEYALIDIIKNRVRSEYHRRNIISYPAVDHLDELALKMHINSTHLLPWKKIDFNLYCNEISQWGLQKGPIVNLNTSRGCSYSCKFCSISKIWGKKMRVLSARLVFREMMYLCEHYGIRSICFREDNFTGDYERVAELCRLLIKSGADIEWAAESRIDEVDEDLLKLMAEANCKCLMLGVESGCDRMLHMMKKDITILQIKKAFLSCHEFGIKTFASVIYGIPGETEKDRQKTLRLLEEIEPTFTESSVFLGIPGSKYYEELKVSGKYEYFDPRTLHIFPYGYKDICKRYINNEQDHFLPY